MNFDLSDDQKMLRDTVASFVKKESPVERVRATRDMPLGYDPAVYAKMGELGWLGVPFPEAYGGYGGTFADAAIAIEQLGAALVPEPYIASVILGGMTLSAAGTDEQKRRWLPSLCDGTLSMALAYAERDSRYCTTDVSTRAESAGAGYAVSGDKVFVDNGQGADLLLVSARTGGGARDRDGVTLFAIDRDARGLSIQPVKTLDGRKAAMVRLDRVEVGAERVIGPVGGAGAIVEDALDRGAAAACAEGAGIQQALLAMTVDYLKTREQFGVKIGVFQALQHRCVDMFIQTELSRSLAIEASIRAGDGSDRDTRQSAVSAAKIQLATGGKWVAQQAIQLHGGIALTEEHDAGLYFKRMHALNTLFGDEEHHLARYASLPTFSAGMRAPSC